MAFIICVAWVKQAVSREACVAVVNVLLCVYCILQAALLQEFDTSDFHSVLVCVPEFVKSQLLEQWLSLHLLPLVLQYFPQMLVRLNI